MTHPNSVKIIPTGTIVVALCNVTVGDTWPPVIYAGDELRIMGYAIDRGGNGVPNAVDVYRVETHRRVQIYMKPGDIQVKELLPSPTFAFQQGTSAYAKHSIWMESHPNRPKILSENERVYVQGTLVRDNKPAYYVKNNAGMEMIMFEEALAAIPHYPANIKAAIQKAFQEGYARGHSRGLCCGRLYKEDTDYRGEKHRETIAYLQEIDDESNH